MKSKSVPKPDRIMNKKAKPLDTPSKDIRCIFSTRLNILAGKAPSGKRYEFMSGEIQPVDNQDYDYLLSLKRDVTGCCSGSPPQSRKYFEVV